MTHKQCGNSANRFTNSLGMAFVWIEPGTFMMGSPGCKPEEKELEIVAFDIDWIVKELTRSHDDDEACREDEVWHEVALTQGYYLQTTPVTQGQWETVMGSNPSRFKDGGSDCPVECVSWFDAREFIQKLNEKKEGECRLPTEAEWEYACRAGSETAYNFGADAKKLGDYAWHGKKSGIKTHPVGQLRPNAWGLYDMHGNVWEWCRDWYGDYPADPVTDPNGPDDGEFRVLRGGSWASFALLCRTACRHKFPPRSRRGDNGFRLALHLG
jgi:formylglycine-generating enzyme required for sulfatase activity